MNARSRAILPSAALVFALTSCGAPTKVTSEWRSPADSAGAIQRVVVVAVQMIPEDRREVEDCFVAELAERGVAAAPSHRVLGEPLPPLEQTFAILDRGGIEGALVLRIRRVSEEQALVPERFWSGPYEPWHTTPASAPTYMVRDDIVTAQSTLWDSADRQAGVDGEHPHDQSRVGEAVRQEPLEQGRSGAGQRGRVHRAVTCTRRVQARRPR